mgnify:CR=1 FL=1
MPVAIGVIVVVLLLVIGAYFLLLGRPRGGAADIRMNPHGPGKTGALSNPQSSPQPTTSK